MISAFMHSVFADGCFLPLPVSLSELLFLKDCTDLFISNVELNKKTVFSGSAAPGAERRTTVTSKDV